MVIKKGVMMKKVFLCGLFLFAFISPVFAGPELVRVDNPEVGKPAVDFTLPSLKVGENNFTQLRDNQSAIIFFWATWCPHCRTALKTINGKMKELEADGVKIVLVDVGEKKNLVKKYMDKGKLPMDVLLDEKTTLSQTYGVMGVPTFIYVNKNGVIADIKHSLVSDYKRVLEKGLN